MRGLRVSTVSVYMQLPEASARSAASGNMLEIVHCVSPKLALTIPAGLA